MPPKQRRVIHEHHQKNAERHGADGRSANFYSRPCEGSNTSCLINRRRSRNFYSRPCERGDRRPAASVSTQPHFYSRPCGRGDALDLFDLAVLFHISTHAPAGGATELTHEENQSKAISTHAPAGGATAPGGTRNPKPLQFLLTPLREGRHPPRRYPCARRRDTGVKNQVQE